MLGKIRSLGFAILGLSIAGLVAAPGSARATSVTLDFDTVAGGSNIVATGSVNTALGTITLFEQTPGTACISCFGTFPGDLPSGTFGNTLVEAGSTDDIGLDFGFDVSEITFNFGGDGGNFSASVLDGFGNVLDSLEITDLPGSGLAPGPHTFSGVGIIRALRFEDQLAGAAIDNVIITGSATVAVPEPGMLAVFGVGLLGLGFSRRKRLI